MTLQNHLCEDSSIFSITSFKPVVLLFLRQLHPQPYSVCVSLLWCFRRSETCYSQEAGSSAWRRAGGDVVVGWTWFWSDTPTWSTASLRKEPSERFTLVSAADVTLHTHWLTNARLSFVELPWRSWTFWTRYLRSKWAWPIKSMDNLCLVSPVGYSHFNIS